jgi:NitT/TauT family transport system ATP-binding protein
MPLGAVHPNKVEGSLGSKMVVGTQQGAMTMENNRFFDDGVFDPASIEDYLARRP